MMMKVTRLLGLFLCFAAAPTTLAQPVCLASHLKDEQSVTFGSFGDQVDISGHTAIVGAPSVVPAAIGKALIFEYDEVAGWTFVQELQPPDGGSGDHFGRRVAIDGDVAVATSLNTDPRATDQ